MKLCSLILGAALLSAHVSMAQSVLTINIVDSATRDVLHGCSVTLLAKDGTSPITDHQNVSLANGSYTVRVSHVSYQEKNIALELTRDTSVAVFLVPKAVAIDEVAILGERAVTMEKGNIVLHPTKLFDGQNAWEVIKNSGYVEISESGDLSVRQKRGTVYINNRKLYLSGEELKNQLQAMPGSLIKKIEIVPNPDASHSSDELAVIRIVTKDSDYVGYRVNAIATAARAAATSNGQSLKTDYSNRNYDLQWLISRNKTVKKTWATYSYDLEKGHWGIGQNASVRSEAYDSFFLFNYYPDKKTASAFTWTLRMRQTVRASMRKTFLATFCQANRSIISAQSSGTAETLASIPTIP